MCSAIGSGIRQLRITAATSKAAVMAIAPGAHNVANALAALAAVRSLDVPLDATVAALETFAGIRPADVGPFIVVQIVAALVASVVLSWLAPEKVRDTAAAS